MQPSTTPRPQACRSHHWMTVAPVTASLLGMHCGKDCLKAATRHRLWLPGVVVGCVGPLELLELMPVCMQGAWKQHVEEGSLTLSWAEKWGCAGCVCGWPFFV